MAAVLFCLLGAWGHPAYAYRPFNSTDAAVAARGEMEIECGPLGYIVDADGRFLVVPSAILNFGFAEGWELVIEGRNFLLVQPAERRSTGHAEGDGPVIEGRAAPGKPAGEPQGPSVGLEVGLLLPGIGTDPGVGASVAGIVSQRWSAVTVHVNGDAADDA